MPSGHAAKPISPAFLWKGASQFPGGSWPIQRPVACVQREQLRERSFFYVIWQQGGKTEGKIQRSLRIQEGKDS